MSIGMQKVKKFLVSSSVKSVRKREGGGEIEKERQTDRERKSETEIISPNNYIYYLHCEFHVTYTEFPLIYINVDVFMSFILSIFFFLHF